MSSSSIDDLPKVMGDDGEFHATDEAVDLSHTTLEGWLALGIFWLLGATVFYQFVTRYVFNDSAAWTEEIARYLLIGTVFVGAAIGVAKNNHIQVDLLYRWLPAKVARALALPGRRAARRVLRGDGRADGADDAEDGQLPDDHHRPADEHRLRRVPVRAGDDGAAFAVGDQGALATRLQRAGAARIDDGRPLGVQHHTMLKIIFLFMMAGGMPVAIAMAGASLVYILATGDLPAVRR